MVIDEYNAGGGAFAGAFDGTGGGALGAVDARLEMTVGSGTAHVIKRVLDPRYSLAYGPLSYGLSWGALEMTFMTWPGVRYVLGSR